jgi:hypothetical protein
VNFALQINARRAKSANDDIGADAFFRRDIAVRVCNDTYSGS